MIHSSFHECTGLKHPVISQGEHLESNPQAHSWMMELLSVSTQGRWNLRAKKKIRNQFKNTHKGKQELSNESCKRKEARTANSVFQKNGADCLDANITWPKHTIGLWRGWRFYVFARFNARYKMMRPPHFTTKCMLCSTIAWSSNDPHVSMVSYNMRVN